ncbi:hypothetical protein [Streptomyces parvus]|uniref:Uncharacterized protein n=1 Tax=Streptomyces parvus TaxID=66428 RepID=A0A7K3S1P9_9ACTN|nr:hypothetical protein [Streptomyces parvus]NEE27003.1 hypothetical protein [Streptomyces sp. SID7982]
MLQCTAVTALPRDEALIALVCMEGGPDDAGDHLDEKPYVLCELGEHDEAAEHAAHLWAAEAEPASLWFLWTVSGGFRVYHRFVSRSTCPVRIHHVEEDYRQWCALYDDHPSDHSFNVRDPLRDAYYAQIRRDAQRYFAHDDPDKGDGQES